MSTKQRMRMQNEKHSQNITPRGNVPKSLAVYPDARMADQSNSISTENTGLCCPVCFEQYRDPRSLICAHTFCEICIHEFVLKQKSLGLLQAGIECPLCRKVTSVLPSDTPPEKWSKIVPGNYALQEVLDSLAKDQTRDEKLCKICPIDETCKIASKFCIQCKKEMCDDCEKIHYKFQDIRSHKIVGIAEKETATIISDELYQCVAHGKQIEFYCIDDKTLCCSSCAIIKHRKCNEVTEIADIAEESNNEMNGLVTLRMQSLKTKANSVKHFFEEKKQQMELQVQHIDQRMQQEEEMIMKLLRETRTKIMKEANDIKYKSIKKINLYEDECDTLLSTIDRSVKTLESIQRHGSASQVFITLQKEERKLTEEIRKSEKYFDDLRYTDLSFETAESVKAVLSSSCLLGELVAPEIKVNIDELPNRNKVKLELIASVDVIQQHEEETLPLYTGLDFLTDERLVVVDNTNDKCLIMNEELVLLNSYKHSDYLYDIIALPDNEVLLTSSNALVTLAVSDENILTNEMTTDLKCRPYSLSLLDSENLVVGTYNSRKPASGLTKSGTEKDLNIKFPEKEWDIDDSRCFFDRNTKKLVVTDKCENEVYLYDTRNKSKVSIRDERIHEPGGVAVVPFDCFFLCSTGTNSVVQISQYGEVLESLEVQMEFPTVLCISKSGSKLALSNSAKNGRKLQLYKIISTLQKCKD